MNYSAEADKAKSVRLIRHAQSAANAGLATIAPKSIPLTELGNTQAQILADQIASPPESIISPPFEREIHTALAVANRYPQVPLEIWAVEEFTYLSPSRQVGTFKLTASLWRTLIGMGVTKKQSTGLALSPS